MDYLVTGCAGFVGARVVSGLLDQGHNVVGVDNLNDYYDVGLKNHRLENLTNRIGFRFYLAGIESATAVNRIFERHQFDAVINLAAAVGVRHSIDQPGVYMKTNGMGNLNLLEAVRRHGIKKYVLASTSSLYAGQQMPFVETLPVNTPISPYAASKKSAETMAWTYHHLYGIDTSIVRYFTVYGPAGRPDMGIFRFIRWIAEAEPIRLFGDGSQSRDFTFVDDIADGTIRALKPLGYEIINLGGGNQPVSINKVLEIIATKLQRKPVIRRQPEHCADMVSTHADITKANELLNWYPKVSLEQGLESCIEWYVENLPWSSFIPLEREQPEIQKRRIVA